MRSPVATALVVAALVAACVPGPAESPTVPDGTPTAAPATSAATPAPTASPSPSVVDLPDGLVAVDIPMAGIRLPVPAGWEQVDADALADETVQAGIAARYPGMDGFLEATKALGDRATPAFLALDKAAANSSVALTPSVSVLLSEPSVSGPMLDFVTGFIADALADTLGSPAPARQRVGTPLGDAVRLAFDLPPDGDTPMAATAWVIGAKAGTLLVTVVGPAGEGPTANPDALMDAAEPLSAPGS